MAIDRSSPEFMFGQIMARLNEGDKVITSLGEKVEGLSVSVGKLPCGLHEERLKSVEYWQKGKNNVSQHSARMSLTLRHGMIIGISSAAAAAGFAILFASLFA